MYDGASNELVGEIAIDAPARFGIAVGAAGRIFVASYTDQSPQLSMIDGSSRKVVAHVAIASFTAALLGLPTAPHGGAIGFPTEITWQKITFTGNPMDIGSANQDPNNTYLTISAFGGPLITVPATPGHYSFKLGPAVQAQTQVVLIPGRS